MSSGSSRYRGYLLVVLTTVLISNTMDSVVLGLSLQDIKAGLNLSDTQLGALTGIAFAFFYSVVGIPIARWADRGNRVAIIAITTALWSGMMALCALAHNFSQLLLIRVGMAVGEAGCVPPSLSLIADYFTRAERPRGVARYMLGWPISLLIGNLAAGWLIQFYGWRGTYVLMGLPGLGLAVLVWLTLKEPRRLKPTRDASSPLSVAIPQQAVKTEGSGQDQVSPSLREVICRLRFNNTLRHLVLGLVAVAFFNTAVMQFLPAFLIRSYSLKPGELGTWFSAIYGATGLLGSYWGGEWASRRATNNERLQLRAAAVAYPLLAVSAAFIYLSTNYHVALGLLGLVVLTTTAANGPLFALVQTLVPSRSRAMSTALVYLLVNLIGVGLGPLAVGALSDALRPLLGEESLRYALLAFCPGFLWIGWPMWRASKTVARDLDATQENRVQEGPPAQRGSFSTDQSNLI